MAEIQHNDVIKKLNTTFREVFNDDSIVLTDNMTAEDIETWDSLTNIRLMVQIEQDFNINFSSSDIADISNVGELIDLILLKI